MSRGGAAGAVGSRLLPGDGGDGTETAAPEGLEEIDAELARSAKLLGREAATNAEILQRADLTRSAMVGAARRLRALRREVTDPKEREEVEAEYTQAVQTRALMDAVQGAAFTIDKRIRRCTGPKAEPEAQAAASGGGAPGAGRRFRRGARPRA